MLGGDPRLSPPEKQGTGYALVLQRVERRGHAAAAVGEHAAGVLVDRHAPARSPAGRRTPPCRPPVLPVAGMMRTAVVLELTMPMAASSAMMAEMVSAGVSPGTAIMSRPTEHTQVMASSLSSVQGPGAGGGDHALVLAHRDERAGQAAHVGGGHDAALLHRVVEQGQGRGGAVGAARPPGPSPPGCAATLSPDGGRRREGQVHDAEGRVQPRGWPPGPPAGPCG